MRNFEEKKRGVQVRINFSGVTEELYRRLDDIPGVKLVVCKLDAKGG